MSTTLGRRILGSGPGTEGRHRHSNRQRGLIMETRGHHGDRFPHCRQ
ncbi:hypothetical protein ACFVZD_42695 [Streptomyces sp. NPDC058287]